MEGSSRAVSSISEFLRARYTERRTVAEAAAGLQCDPENGWGITDSSIYAATEKRRWISPHIGMLHESESAEHVVANNPAVVLADLDAKLVVIAIYEDAERSLAAAAPGTPPHDLMTGAANTMRHALRHLAVPFAKHPDYDQRWTP